MANSRNRRKREASRAYYEYMKEGIYVHGSQARALDTWPREEEVRPPSRKTRPEKKVVVKNKPKKLNRKKPRGTQVEYVLDYVPVEKMPVSFVMLLCIFVIGVGVNLFLYAYVSQQQVVLQKTNTSIQTTKENIMYKNAEIVASVDLDDIAHLAQTKLQMSPPKSYQIIEIEPKAEAYFIQNGDVEAAGFLNNLASFIKVLGNEK